MKTTLSYKDGYIEVGDSHQMYYELWGNPKGIPILFFHGGPGSGFRKKHRKLFNPKIHNVIFYDQRGAGNSKPFAETKNNTTPKLLQDAEMLLNYLKISKVYLFGRSWGATMALLFSIKNPKKVLGMNIGGVFLASKEEIDHYMLGGTEKHFPEAWERFINLVPKSKRGDLITYYLEKMHSKNAGEKEKYLYEWSFYENSIMKMKLDISKIEKMFAKDKTYRALSPIEAIYMKNNCFIPDNFILNSTDRLGNIPVVIIQGRYDMVCPPVYAYKLSQKLKNSVLYLVVGGHSREGAVKKKTVEEMNKIKPGRVSAQ